MVIIKEGNILTKKEEGTIIFFHDLEKAFYCFIVVNIYSLIKPIKRRFVHYQPSSRMC